MRSADSTASSAAANVDAGFRGFVTLLTVRVLYKSDALESRSLHECLEHTQRLVYQTMEGLSVDQGFSWSSKSFKSICKAVLQDLQHKFGGGGPLKEVLLLQDPWMDKIIVHTLQVHIREFSASVARWRHALKVSVRALVVILYVFVMVSPFVFFIVVFVMVISL